MRVPTYLGEGNPQLVGGDVQSADLPVVETAAMWSDESVVTSQPRAKKAPDGLHGEWPSTAGIHAGRASGRTSEQWRPVSGMQPDT